MFAFDDFLLILVYYSYYMVVDYQIGDFGTTTNDKGLHEQEKQPCFL